MPNPAAAAALNRCFRSPPSLVVALPCTAAPGASAELPIPAPSLALLLKELLLFQARDAALDAFVSSLLGPDRRCGGRVERLAGRELPGPNRPVRPPKPPTP